MSFQFSVCPSLRSILVPHLLDGQVVYEQESQKMYLFHDNAWIELGNPETDSSQVYKNIRRYVLIAVHRIIRRWCVVNTAGHFLNDIMMVLRQTETPI